MRTLRLFQSSLWHQKGFSIRLDLPEAKRILVYYDNGNTKPWWIRSKRRHRFRRWTWLKHPFVFRSIGNEKSRGLVLFVIKSWVGLPERIWVPIQTQRLDISNPEMNVNLTGPNFSSANILPNPLRFSSSISTIVTLGGRIEYKRPVFKSFQFETNPITEPELKSFENINL